MKLFVKKYFKNLYWFYKYLGLKLFSLVIFSVLLGLLDGIGLSMFLPILQMTNGESNDTTKSSESLNAIIKWLAENDIEFDITIPLFLMFLFFSLKGISKFFSEVYRVNLQQLLLKKVRLETLKLLASLKFKAYVSSDKGRIQNTLTGELDRIQQSFIYYSRVLENIILVFLYMAFAYLIDFKFAVLVTIAGVIINIFFSVIFKKTKRSSSYITAGNNYFQSQVSQLVSNFKYLKSTGFIDEYQTRLNHTIKNIEKTRKKIGLLNGIQVSTREPIMILVIVVVIILQLKVLKGDLAPIIISLLFFYRALSSLNGLQNSWNVFLSLSGSVENLIVLQHDFLLNKQKYSIKSFSSFNNNLELSKVSFSYAHKNVLNNINIKIKKNSSTAIIGESGSGKTTLVNVITGLLEIEQGDLLIDGVNLKEYDIRTFQNRIGYITQEPVIFDDTLFNNITLWDEKNQNNIEKFLKVLATSSLIDLYEQMPLKEETILGYEGINLSGGQRQRISIARELYKDIDILIFDEATSSLDSKTELQIQKSINSLKGKYTIIIIAHRLSTIKDVDEVIILNNGEINEKGTFNGLIKTNLE